MRSKNHFSRTPHDSQRLCSSTADPQGPPWSNRTRQYVNTHLSHYAYFCSDSAMVSSKSMSDRCSWIPKLLYMSGVECPQSTLKTIPLTRFSLQLFAWQESHITEVRTASVTQVRLGYLQNWSASMEEQETVCDAAKSRSKKMHKSEPMASLCSEAKQHAASVTQVRPGYSQNWSAALEEHETVLWRCKVRIEADA